MQLARRVPGQAESPHPVGALTLPCPPGMQQMDSGTCAQNVTCTIGAENRTVSCSALQAYYQGQGSIRANGLYPDTVQYARNVQALRKRFR